MLSDPLFLIVAIACLAVAFVLARGVMTFGKEGIENSKRANRLMQWRIALQVLAVALILAFVYFRRQSGG